MTDTRAGNEIWTIQKLVQWTTGHFAAKNISSARLDAELLLAKVLGCARLDLYLKFDQPMKDLELKNFRELVVRRSRNEPVAYILGRQEFYGRPFEVGPGVLIPRPETEGIVDEALQWVESRDGNEREPGAFSKTSPEKFNETSHHETLKVLDIGSGSGCIGVTLAAEIPFAHVSALDVSEAGVKFTAANAKNLEVVDRVAATLTDFNEFKSNEKFDLIVSNPPYVGRGAESSLPKDVAAFEPAEALYGGLRGHEILEKWIPAMARLLASDGLLLCEIGFDQGGFARDFAGRYFESVEILKDYSGHDRIIKAQRPHSDPRAASLKSFEENSDG